MQAAPLSVFALLLAAVLPVLVCSCSNFIATPGATADGSSIIAYSADSPGLFGELYFQPHLRHAAGAKREIYEWDTGLHIGAIPEVEETYGRVGNMNEFQLTIGETTYGGREELLHNAAGLLDYGSLINVTLERAKTAREAIHVMTSLLDTYGYFSEGESFSIADPHEAWVMDLIGKGENSTGLSTCSPYKLLAFTPSLF